LYHTRGIARLLELTPVAESVLRADLLAAQHELRKQGAGPVLVVLAGPETADRGDTANELNAWMDPRWLKTWAWGEPSDEERERPWFWRYWRALPPRGLVALIQPSAATRYRSSCIVSSQ